MRRRVYELAETLEELATVPLAERIVTSTGKLLEHDEYTYGVDERHTRRYWIEKGTLEPLQAQESWLPAIVLIPHPVSESDTTTTKHT